MTTAIATGLVCIVALPIIAAVYRSRSRHYFAAVADLRRLEERSLWQLSKACNDADNAMTAGDSQSLYAWEVAARQEVRGLIRDAIDACREVPHQPEKLQAICGIAKQDIPKTVDAACATLANYKGL